MFLCAVMVWLRVPDIYNMAWEKCVIISHTIKNLHSKTYLVSKKSRFICVLYFLEFGNSCEWFYFVTGRMLVITWVYKKLDRWLNFKR